MLIDAFDKGSYIKIIPSENKIIGYSTKNSGGVPDNFKNYFVIRFDKPFEEASVWHGKRIEPGLTEIQDDHVGALLQFSTRKGEQIHASSGFFLYQPGAGWN